MNNTQCEQQILLRVALRHVPPLIRESLLNDDDFKLVYGLETEGTIDIGDSGVHFPSSEFFKAVRAALAGSVMTELKDANNQIWRLSTDRCTNELSILVLTSGQRRLTLPDFFVLSEDVSERLRSLALRALDVNLPIAAQEAWKNILKSRALGESEVDSFFQDIWDTPTLRGRVIREEIEAGKCRISTLVPNSRRYFERLVGVYDGSSSIRDYAAGACREVFKNLAEWRQYDGFLLSLLLSSHSALTAEISVDQLDLDSLLKVLKYVEDHGDMLSRVGAVEVGLRALADRPEIEPSIFRLVQQIRNDSVNEKASQFNLLSAMFVLVDGELARTRILADLPPFYRRLASLAQAALINRELVKIGGDYTNLCLWSFNNRGLSFYMQSLVDMRTEPRWHPELASAPQFQAEFLGRVMIAGTYFLSNIGEGELRNTFLGDGEQSLFKFCKFPSQFFPGPLECADEHPSALPDDLARAIEEQLGSPEVGANSFIQLVNSSMIFRVMPDHAALAARALKLGNYSLAKIDDSSQVLSILNGLATVAALSRNPILADDLRILVRRYWRHSKYGFSVEEAIRIALVAAASREDLMEWRRFAGDWLTELAFGHLDEGEGEVFHSHLLTLLHSAPELWVSCASADAALRAWCYRR